MNNISDLVVTLIKMQAKTNEKMEYYHARICQLEHIIQSESSLRTSSIST